MATQDAQQPPARIEAVHLALIVVATLAVGVFLGIEIVLQPTAFLIKAENPAWFDTITQIRSVVFVVAVGGLASAVGLYLYAE